MRRLLITVGMAVAWTAVVMADLPRTKVIFDTDMVEDYDDVGALATLHALADEGKCEILATISSTRGNQSVAAIEILNAFYGRPDIPVGGSKEIGVLGTTDGPDRMARHGTYAWLAQKYVRDVRHSNSDAAADANAVYRKALAAAPDGSVVICCVGFLTNLRRLLETGPDTASPLNGRDLVAKKVRALYTMAGDYPKGREYNIQHDASSAKRVFAQWPTPIYVADFNLGRDVYSGRTVAERQYAYTNPVHDVYERCLPSRADTHKPDAWDREEGGHCSWDPITVLAAVTGAETFFTVAKGGYHVADDGFNTWVETLGNGGGALQFAPERGWTRGKIASVLDDLIAREPVCRSRPTSIVNPLPGGTAADPYVVYDPETRYYYLLCTDGESSANRLVLRRSRQAATLRTGESQTIYVTNAADRVYGSIWAPEMHKASDGRWYVWTSGTTDPKRWQKYIFVLQSKTADPFDGFVFLGHPDPELCAIDPTLTTFPNGRMYACISVAGKDGQFLQIRELSKPWLYGAGRADIAQAEYDWERVPPYRDYPILEGAFFLRSPDGKRLFIVYSANGCWSDDYALGVLEYQGGDPCRTETWKKYPRPVFKKGNGIFGPGHASFFKSPDGTETWMAYHSLERSDPEGQPLPRYMNLQRIDFDETGFPVMGDPVPHEKPMPRPSGEADVAKTVKTYCNPLSLPNYPRGVLAQRDELSERLGALGLVSRNGAFREAGDPTVVVEKGSWYLYVSGAMAGCWKSNDYGATWRHIDIGLPEFAFGYAPTIVKFEDQFLLCGGWGSDGGLWRGESPEGPFTRIGDLVLPQGDGVPELADPMLFADEGRLYLYWGCSPTSGIWGCELDPKNPCRAITPAKRLIAYDPENNPWQKFPNKPFGFVEGAWMFKRDGGYYLMFAAGGTEFPTYATGVARSSSPLGDFVLQRNNPVFYSPKGVVTGTAHGSVICDENNEWWYFYTIHASIRHQFERRIGMDRLTFDKEGNVVAQSASSSPQPLSGESCGTGGLWSVLKGVYYSAGAAFDQNLETEFTPLRLPYELEYEFLQPEIVCANRVIWSDGGYDPKSGVDAGPVHYRVLLKMENGQWMPSIDASLNDQDLLVDYREIRPVRALAARLEVIAAPTGILPRVVEWTMFGHR